MPRFARALPVVFLAARCFGQTPDLSPVFNFEAPPVGGAPAGWGVNPPGSVVIDSAVVHGGKQSARLDRAEGAAGPFSGFVRGGPVNFAGQRLEIRAFLKTKDVTGYVGLWLREDGDGRPGLQFNNMQDRQLKGTNDWAEYSFVLPLNPEATSLSYGVFVVGTGTVWADDMQLLVDGKPFWNAPPSEPTVLDTDTEFRNGSRLSIGALTEIQTANLARLGKVWGFLKYHHPAVTSGKRNWDFDLFRVMPAVLAAPDRAAANAAMAKWVAGLGPVTPCSPCAQFAADGLALTPSIDWIHDKTLLGADLSQELENIYANRPPANKQFYVSLNGGAGNPKFEHESARNFTPGDQGYQILAALRFWNAVQYFSPNREIIGEDWDAALVRVLPRIAAAKTREEYALELLALIAIDHDTHANLWSGLDVRPPTGACSLPLRVRFVEGQPAVVGYRAASEKAGGVQVGDAITELDGVPVAKLVESWTPYYADSNQAARLRDMGMSFGRGACGPSRLKVRRGAEEIAVTIDRLSAKELANDPYAHDLPGPGFRLLSKDVAYLKLSDVKTSEAKNYVTNAAGTKGWVIDIRNYPSDFVVFALGNLLVNAPTAFVRFTHADPANPGAFYWGEELTLQPAQPHYTGKIVILIDEITQSSAEYHTMAFRTAPGAKVIGSTTAGADGNVSNIPLPGGQNTMISGLGVFYPDKRPTQRVGIVPDIVVTPTLAGVRAGRDEVLEAAVREILGPSATPDDVKAMTKH